MINSPKKRANSTLALSIFLLSIGSNPLSAAEEQQADAFSTITLEEIIVTATRRDTSLQDVAASVAAVSGDDLLGKGITSFSDLSNTISGVTLEQPASAISSAVYIRGIGTGGTSPAVQSVGVIVDGVYQVSSGAAFTELMDIERVEVLRGPQGTLFGKNTTAGVIRIFTADPDTSDFSGKAQVVMGSLNNKEVRGLVNIPFADDLAALRLNAYSAERDGHTKNDFLNLETHNEDRSGYRGKLLIQPTDNVELKLSAEHHERDSNTDQGLAEYSSALITAAAPTTLPDISIGHSQENHAGRVTDDIDRYTINIGWDMGSHKLTTISAYEELDLTLTIDYDRTILTASPAQPLPLNQLSRVDNDTKRQIQTHEIQLASNTDNALSYLIGAYWQNDQITSNTITFDPVNAPTPSVPDPSDMNSQALFGNATYQFDDQWSASIGVRYTEDERAGRNNITGGGTDYEDRPNTVTTFHETTYSAKLQYQATEDTLYYLSHDKGFKSGGIQREFSLCASGFGACIDADQAFWEPETSLNYELGIKSEFFDNKLRLNTALFYQTYDDFQVTQTIGSNVIVSNATEVESFGIETEFMALISDNFTMDGSVTFVQAEYDDFDDAPCASPTTPGCSAGTQDLSGKTVDHAPEWSFNIGGEYRSDFALIAGTQWFTRSDVIYRDDQNLNAIQAPETEEDSYVLLNSRLGIEAQDASWKLTLWGKNLTDTDYLTTAEANIDGVTKIPGLPRTYGLTMDVSF